jgi:hypothetical protein
VEAVLPLRLGRAQLALPAGARFDVSVIGSEPDGERRQWKLVSGASCSRARRRRRARSSTALAALLRLEPGSSLLLRGPCGGDGASSSPAPFRVSGVARFRSRRRASTSSR